MDQGHKETDELLEKIEQKIRKQYAQAAKELTAKLEKHLKKFEAKDKMMLAKLDAGEITDAEYFRWRMGQIMTGKHWEQMRDQLAADLVHSHQLADSVVNGYLPEVYALNHNYGTYQIEHDSQMSTSYTLYNRQAVERLLRDDPDMLPQPSVNVPKAERWNKQHIQSSVLQGILQGESMDKIARRMRDVCGMDARAAIRNARTATTGAENAGRLDSMNRALGMGIGLKKLWLATRDSRTRDSHVLLDGELREVNEKFSNGCMHPGDPHGRPEEVYNCRCAMRSKVDGADPYSPNLSRNKRLGGMSYEQWKQEARERINSKFVRDYDGEKIKIVFADKFNDERWSETKRVINKLANEYNTRLAEVTGGAERGAGDTDITGHRMRLNSSHIEDAIHEFAHTLAGTNADKVGLTNDADFWKEIKKIKRAYRKDVGWDTSRWISSYEHGSNSLDEFMAEAFTLAKMKEMGYAIPDKYGKDLTYAKQVLDIVNRYFGKTSDRNQNLAVEERARLYRNNSNIVPIQALDAPGFIEIFKKITGNPDTNRAIYDSAVEILKHRNGTNKEDLYLIDMDSGEVFHRHNRSTSDNGIDYDDEINQAIMDAHKAGRRIVTIHNHPNGLPPTLDDGSSAFVHEYNMGVAVGHNLEVWTYGRTTKECSTEFCNEVHSALEDKLKYMLEINDSEWYNHLNQYGMEIKKL